MNNPETVILQEQGEDMLGFGGTPLTEEDQKRYNQQLDSTETSNDKS